MTASPDANFRELWAALRLIRQAVEEFAPPGAVPNDEYLTPEPMREAEAIIRGIHAIAAARPTDRESTGDTVLSDDPTPEDLRAKKMNEDGGYEVVKVFSGSLAQRRAMVYASREFGEYDVIRLEPYWL